MEFNQRLTEMMKKRGWTNYRLAKLMDCSQSTVAHWIAGDTKPQRATMKRLAEVFETSVEYLNGQEKKSTPEGGHTDAEFIDLYDRASPEIREAVLTLLRSATPRPSTQDAGAKD